MFSLLADEWRDYQIRNGVTPDEEIVKCLLRPWSHTAGVRLILENPPCNESELKQAGLGTAVGVLHACIDAHMQVLAVDFKIEERVKRFLLQLQ